MAKREGQKQRAIGWPVIVFLVVLICAVLWWRGYDYYTLELSEQIYHPEYKVLRSSGLLGYGYGVVGTVLIFANLLYLARRRLARWHLGSMRAWLDIHVFTGLAGSAFILFHSTFKARSTISKVTAGSLVVVVLTGLIGRFLFALVPKRDAKALESAIAAAGARSPGLDAELRAVLDAHPIKRHRGGFIGAILALPALRRVAIARLEAVRVLTGNAGIDRPLADRIANEAYAEPRAVAQAQLLRTWRSMHRFFAILMLITVVFHIGVAWYYGYRWIFSE